MRLMKSLRGACFLATLILVAACGDSPTAAPPGIQPQITNNTDDFAYQITDPSNVTGSYDYTWANTGTLAKVTHSSDAGATGTATLTLKDAVGTVVYTGALATSGQPVSSPAGVAGNWTITMTFASYSNTQVNFGVVKN